MDTEKQALQRFCGEQVQKYRMMQGLTQEELADLVGTEQNYISQIETGRKMMSVEMLRKISKTLSVSADVLLFPASPAQHSNILRLLEKQDYETRDSLEAILRVCIAHFGNPKK